MTQHEHITEQDIEIRLSAIQPEPGARLATRLQNAPWKQPAQRPHIIGQHRWAAAAATLLMAVGLTVFTPLGALAQAVLTHFFMPAATENITRTYTMPEPTPMADAPVYQPQTLADAQALVDFGIVQPQFIPAGYVFESADVYDGVVYLAYRIPRDFIGRNLVIKQMHADDYVGWEVGANADIQPVTIGDNAGEYVKGWWGMTEPATPIGEENGVTTFEATLGWDESLGMHLLHWQRGDFAYEILYQESGNIISGRDTSAIPGLLTLADLITVAESVQ
jgi:hypothetical protein